MIGCDRQVIASSEMALLLQQIGISVIAVMKAFFAVKSYCLVEPAATVFRVEGGGKMFLQIAVTFLPVCKLVQIPDDFIIIIAVRNLEFHNIVSNYWSVPKSCIFFMCLHFLSWWWLWWWWTRLWWWWCWHEYGSYETNIPVHKYL